MQFTITLTEILSIFTIVILMPLRVVGVSIARDEGTLNIISPESGDIWEIGLGYFVNWYVITSCATEMGDGLISG
jgi:hypothetical protein